MDKTTNEVRLGRRIQMRLDELGWKQSDLLARVPGLGKGTLSAMIVNNRVASEWSDEIAEALGVEHRWLQKGVEPKLRSGWAPALPRSAISTLVTNVATLVGDGSVSNAARRWSIPQTTLNTLLLGTTKDPRLSTIDTIASATGYAPWQLLVPSLDPADPPTLSGTELPSDERELLRLYRQLDADTRPALLNRARSLQEL